MSTTFLCPGLLRNIVEPGVLDERPRLAFTHGHCHSFAQALRAEIGGELVALRKDQEPFDHVLVRDADGRMLDIRGARSASDLTADGGELIEIDNDSISRLPAEAGWVPSDPDAATSWVAPLLLDVQRGVPYRPDVCITGRFALNPDVMLHLEWAGAGGGLQLVLYGRSLTVAPRVWTRCSSFPVPKNGVGEREIDLSIDRFNILKDTFRRRLPQRRDVLLRNLRDPPHPGTPVSPPS